MLGRHGGPCTQMCTHAPQSEKGTSVHMHRASHPVPCCPGLVPVSLELTPGKHAGKSQLIQGGPLTADRHLTLQHVSLPKAPPAPPPQHIKRETVPPVREGSGCPPLPAQAHLAPGNTLLKGSNLRRVWLLVCWGLGRGLEILWKN